MPRKTKAKPVKEFGTMPVTQKSEDQKRRALERLALATPELCRRFENLLNLMNDAIEHYGETGTDGFPDEITAGFEEFFAPMRSAQSKMANFKCVLLDQLK